MLTQVVPPFGCGGPPPVTGVLLHAANSAWEHYQIDFLSRVRAIHTLGGSTLLLRVEQKPYKANNKTFSQSRNKGDGDVSG